MFGFFSRKASPADMDFETLANAVRSGDAIVVDVREPHEFAAGHIPGAVSLPLSRFDPRSLPTGKQVVLVCQAGGRSRVALGKTHAAGRNEVKHYAGGMSQWRSLGGAVTA